MTPPMKTNPTSDEPVYECRRQLYGASLVSHLFLMHGHYARSVHDTEESNNWCHEADHDQPFGAGYIPHVHTLDLEDLEEWSWQ